MLLKNSLISINEFFYSSKSQIRKLYLKSSFYNKKISKTVESCNFENLRKMEQNEGFIEAAYSEKLNKKVNFFHLGEKNNWKNLLNQEMEKKITEAFHHEMIRYISLWNFIFIHSRWAINLFSIVKC